MENDQIHALRLQLEEMGAVDVSLQTVLSICAENDTDCQAERQQISRNSTFECPICLEEKQEENGKKLGDCDDLLCENCGIKYLEQIVSLPVPCPTCRKPLNPDECLSLLTDTPTEERFARLISESYCERLRYCANEECNAPFEWVPRPEVVGLPDEFRVTCPLCNKQTCVQCRVEWHEDQTCEEYQNNNDDINAVGELARRNNWMPCPSCNALVEKREGDCNYVRCLCGTAFCHNCGAAYLDDTPTADNQHGQPGCDCELFLQENQNRNVARCLPQAIANANRRQFGRNAVHHHQLAGAPNNLSHLRPPHAHFVDGNVNHLNPHHLGIREEQNELHLVQEQEALMEANQRALEEEWRKAEEDELRLERAQEALMEANQRALEEEWRKAEEDELRLGQAQEAQMEAIQRELEAQWQRVEEEAWDE